MAIEPSRLEQWLRSRYFDARIDISSSGVENYSLGELRGLLGINFKDLDATVFRDSPSLGGEPLREAIAHRFGSRTEQVMVTHGASEGLFLAINTLIRPGDDVIVQRPAYGSLHSIAGSLGATVRHWDLIGAGHIRADLAELRRLMLHPPRALIVNFPHNPTGITLDADAYTEFLDIVASTGALLLWDGAFAELIYDGQPLADPASRYERCLSFGTLSKAYGLPGIRVGWCIGPPDVLDDMVALRDYISLNTSPLTELLATRAIASGDVLIHPRLDQARRNREMLMGWAADNADIVELHPPDGGVACFPRFPRTGSVDGICTDLSNDRGVLVVPGSCFGYPDRMRIGIGGPTDELEQGLQAVAQAVR